MSNSRERGLLNVDEGVADLNLCLGDENQIQTKLTAMKIDPKREGRLRAIDAWILSRSSNLTTNKDNLAFRKRMFDELDSEKKNGEIGEEIATQLETMDKMIKEMETKMDKLKLSVSKERKKGQGGKFNQLLTKLLFSKNEKNRGGNMDRSDWVETEEMEQLKQEIIVEYNKFFVLSQSMRDKFPQI